MKLLRNKTAALTPDDRAVRVQYICLLAVLLMMLAFFALEDRASGVAYLLAEHYMALPAMAFLGASFCRELPRKNRLALYAGLFMVVFFFSNQVLHQVMESDSKKIGSFVCTYALCLPFAGAADDAKRQRGLKWMAGVFLAAGTMLTAYAALLLLDAVPEYLQNHVYWDGSRFHAMGHPNICATVLMVGVAMAAGFAAMARKLWVKGLLAVLAVLQFGAMSLTNGRTTIIMTCLLLGGIAFCALRGRGWKRFALALLAAAVVMTASFCVSRSVYSWNQTRLTLQMQNEPAAEAEPAESQVSTEETEETAGAKEDQVLVSEQYQGTMADDMKTLNGRTWIWLTAKWGLQNNPQIKYFGTECVEMILTRYNAGPIDHTHNSWLEALYRMGLPGLAAALALTIAAIWSVAVVLWRNTDLWKSCIALLTVCLLGCAMLEPYLFVADINYFYLDFLFQMCLGYLWLWRGEKEA